jgi:hypothetical protein
MRATAARVAVEREATVEREAVIEWCRERVRQAKEAHPTHGNTPRPAEPQPPSAAS